MARVIGLDFGTTNSAIAVADTQRHATLASFKVGDATTTSFRSILYFPPKERATGKTGAADQSQLAGRPGWKQRLVQKQSRHIWTQTRKADS